MLLQKATLSLVQVGKPFVLAGDFNMAPAQLEASGFLHWTNGVVVQPQHSGGIGRYIDFFVVSADLEGAVFHCSEWQDMGSSVHKPNWIGTHGVSNDKWVQVLRRNARFPTTVPTGCLPPASDYSSVGDTLRDGGAGISRAWKAFMDAMEIELVGTFGADTPVHTGRGDNLHDTKWVRDDGLALTVNPRVGQELKA